ncbi:MAG: lipoyl(octanoyl) transferase LipB [Rhodothermales bacterium]|nr:lipoyl(octanoyl) transferase LipB [Rhodothermales bacterium]
MPQHILICRLGRVPYAPAWALQRQIQTRLVEAKRAEPPRSIPHVILEVEHPPVYTLGKSGNPEHLLATEAELAAQGATFHHIDRGGDITYHGPGQLVVYPILDLDRFTPDIHRYLRELEEAVIRSCADFGVPAERVAGRTGVWVPADEWGGERKICAMGIRCSRWVTMHGLALNINTDLSFFSRIIPCGIVNRDVTSLAREAGHAVDEGRVAERLEAHFAERFNATIDVSDGAGAYDILASFLGQSLDPELAPDLLSR